MPFTLGAKLSKRRNTGAKVTARQRPKPKAKITKRSKTKKSQKLTTSSTSSTNKRAKRSLLIANGITNATFNDMIHSFSIISPLEDMDDQDLQFWQKLNPEEHKLCFSAISLLISSLSLITLAILFAISLMISLGKLRQNYPQKTQF